MTSFIIDETLVSYRLDKALSLLMPDTSRTNIELTIEKGNVSVNNKVCLKGSYKVKLNDLIEFQSLPVIDDTVKPVNIPLDILYEDSDIIVINKPKGMVVHPANGHYNDTLVNALLYHCNDLSGINGVNRPGIVHRLDKDTSGVLVACKNDKAHNSIAAQLADRTCSKTYLTLVKGIISEQKGRIEAPIGRDNTNRLKYNVVDDGKESITEFEIIKRFNNATYLQVHLLTGRTHQIRVHFKYIGHNVLNDPLYGKEIYNDIQGQILHAYKLKLIHPTTNKPMEFTAPIPDYFNLALKRVEEDF